MGENLRGNDNANAPKLLRMRTFLTSFLLPFCFFLSSSFLFLVCISFSLFYLLLILSSRILSTSFFLSFFLSLSLCFCFGRSHLSVRLLRFWFVFVWFVFPNFCRGLGYPEVSRDFPSAPPKDCRPICK
jgi:hypothetical protein